MSQPTIAVFRPDDDRLETARKLLADLDADPLADPMLEVEATGVLPRSDAEYTIFTSKTAADIVAWFDWDTDGGLICAIGTSTAEAFEAVDYEVDIVPEKFTSTGLVEYLADDIDGTRVEVARSDHGSDVLLDGLEDAGAYVHETILYQLVRPDDAGISTERAAEGTLDGVLFTSSLTVEHFLDAAVERGVEAKARAGLDEAIVGAIGEPTRKTAEGHGIEVDIVAEEADFEVLARSVREEIDAVE
jgi:uroporphyrinogen-III synthase